MKILVYCGHPAQYHFFKNALKILRDKGHEIKLLIKTKDILENLVVADGWKYENIQKKSRKNNRLSILSASLSRTLKVTAIAAKWKADVLAGTDSSIAQAAWLLGKTAFTTLEDDVEIISNLARLTYPFTTKILVPAVCRVGKWENKKIGYEGYMKLAYLHPKYFTSDKAIPEKYGITGDYILIRLAKLTAHHDAGIKGINRSLVADIINVAEKHGVKVYISSEIELETDLRNYRLPINPVDIHHIMAFSRLLVSDSQSMSVEAAMLGIPSLRFSDFAGRISVLEELEKRFGLTFGFKTSQCKELLMKIEDILSDKKSKELFRQKRRNLLENKIDVTAMLVDTFENYKEIIRKS